MPICQNEHPLIEHVRHVPWAGLLVDAHRHGLYDQQDHWSLSGIPVEKWEREPTFRRHEHWTKQLHGESLATALTPWLKASVAEGIGTVLDFSGKHDRGTVADTYEFHEIGLVTTIFWDNWQPGLEPRPLALILPDERFIEPEIAEVARSFLAESQDGWITLHTMESTERAAIGIKRLGGSLVEWLAGDDILGPRTLLVHMNAANASDFGLAIEASAKVVLCPSVRSALGNPVPQPPAGIDLFFGVDSPLVSGERSLLAQARLEMGNWSPSQESKNAERAATALLRPLRLDSPPPSTVFSALAEALFNSRGLKQCQPLTI